VPRRLTHDTGADSTGVWSHDGRWIYFNSDRSGRKELWKIPIEEEGPAEQVTQDGADEFPAVSRDGRFLYYSKSSSGIWRVPVDGGEETEVLKETVAPHSWALGRNGLYFVKGEIILWDRSSTYSIQYLDFETGQARELFRRVGPYSHRFLAVSPDEEWLLFSELPSPSAELMLVENFR